MKKNIQLIWSILCQESSIDANTNVISLFKVLEEIKVNINSEGLDKLKNNPTFDPTKPIHLPITSQLVILWKNLSNESNLKFPIKIVLKDPNKKIIQEINKNAMFQKNKERLRVIISMNGFPFTKSGEYTYFIMTKQTKDDSFKEVGSIPIKVNSNLEINNK